MIWAATAARCMRVAAAALALALASGCASLGSNPADPLEPINRKVFAFNDTVDRAVTKPIAQGYQKVVPEPVRTCVGNFFYNMSVPLTAVNNLLQGKVVSFCQDITRFTLNTIFGFGGCVDIATELGIERNRTDIGETLGRWGMPPGPYLVLPIFGPSTVRDSTSLLVDLGYNPITQINDDNARLSLVVLRAVDTRASLLRAEQLLDSMGIDKYNAIRTVYLQQRLNAIYDGNPPDADDDKPQPGNKDKTSQAPARERMLTSGAPVLLVMPVKAGLPGPTDRHTSAPAAGTAALSLLSQP
ncbi:MAG TPA: VacJ family lipoprotein [Burkholderiaceae bacterium]|nr:VacJ family lipoprotein [Burkholderiaceae bacterium]